MTRIELVTTTICPFGLTCLAVLYAKSVPFELLLTDRDGPPDWFTKASPNGSVPVLRHDDRIVRDSVQINEYLDGILPPLLHPTNAERRALNRSAIAQAAFFTRRMLELGTANNAEEFSQSAEQIRVELRPLEATVVGQPYFNGATFSQLDATYVPFCLRHVRLTKCLGNDPLGMSERLLQWRDAVVAWVSDRNDLFRLHGELFLAYSLRNSQHLRTLAANHVP